MLFSSEGKKPNTQKINWYTECLDNVNSYSNISFFSVWNPKFFLDKFWSKNSKLFILTEH